MAAKWYSSIIYFIIYICAFPTLICQNFLFNHGKDHDCVDVTTTQINPLYSLFMQVCLIIITLRITRPLRDTTVFNLILFLDV